MAMDIEEFRELILELGEGLNSLCDDLYAATQEPLNANDEQELINQGKSKIATYENLLNATSGGMKEEVEGQRHFIEEIKEFVKELSEKEK